MPLPADRRWARRGERVDPDTDAWHDVHAAMLRGARPLRWLTGGTYELDQGPECGFSKPLTEVLK